MICFNGLFIIINTRNNLHSGGPQPSTSTSATTKEVNNIEHIKSTRTILVRLSKLKDCFAPQECFREILIVFQNHSF